MEANAQIEDDMIAVVQSGVTRDQIAKHYSSMLRLGVTRFDFARINSSILVRFKKSGLEWIKRRALDIMNEPWR